MPRRMTCAISVLVGGAAGCILHFLGLSFELEFYAIPIAIISLAFSAYEILENRRAKKAAGEFPQPSKTGSPNGRKRRRKREERKSKYFVEMALIMCLVWILTMAVFDGIKTLPGQEMIPPAEPGSAATEVSPTVEPLKEEEPKPGKEEPPTPTPWVSEVHCRRTRT